MNQIALTVNGKRIDTMVEARTHLGDFLREQLRLTGTHLGCEHGVCGACTVLLNDKPIRSCITFAVACDGGDIRTIESFAKDDLMNRLREAFSREHGLQCGFCTAGMLITARDICIRKPGASEEKVRIELSGNLCRCTGYVGIVNAVKAVAAEQVLAAQATPNIKPQATLSRSTPMPAFVPAARQDGGRVIAEKTVVRGTDEGMLIEEAIEVDVPVQAVWKALGDIPTAASCLPGAEILEHDARSAKGRISVKFGPMRAAFTGAATIERNDNDMTGSIRGAGIDSLSKTRAKGHLTYRVSSAAQKERTRIEIQLRYNLVGPLAQFSRSGLVKDFAQRLMVEFAKNLNERITRPEAPRRQAELRAGALFLSVMCQRIKRLFGATS
jgi:aerobic carbon-monoxide dehydrogenase small subunit